MSTQAGLDWTAADEHTVDLIQVPAIDAVHIRARVAGTAGITAPWRLFRGDAGVSIGMDHFGASADFRTLYQEFGLTAERVAAVARESLARVMD